MPTRHLPPTTPLPAEDMAGETRPLTEAEPPLSSRHYHPLLGHSNSITSLISLMGNCLLLEVLMGLFKILSAYSKVPPKLEVCSTKRSGPSLPFPNFSETSIISNRVTNLVKPSVFLMQPPLSTYMIPSTSSSTPTTPINGLGITRDKVRDTLMRLVQELVFRDSKLMKMPDVSIFKSLLVCDVSYNEIPSLNGVSKVSSTLKELYVSKNEVTKMEELDHLYNLHILELGSNRLRVMENLHNLTNLQELWLGRNRIRTVNLCGLKCIRKISLQSNRLTNMTGFQVCYLDSLFFIDKQEQRIIHSYGLLLCRLEDLWMNDNQIASLDGFDLALAGSRDKLTSIYVEHNPCVRLFIRHICFFKRFTSLDCILNANFPNYTKTLRQFFPNLGKLILIHSHKAGP
ncbi:hypothetical protein IFM89_011836 [Coptis chinensis]|uniref:Uncharacterized protein n=1 Tax=Coptis chinensis TaxID=261450 RepID=A0A835H3S1_9MAGN|nr:hypothetical protein IFM89_011836 [Coptis chinensis]